MEAKHTPGPWEVDHRSDDVLTVVPTGRDYPICDLGSVDADDYDADIIATLHADARLIATAPDLLVALELFEERLPEIARQLEQTGNPKAAQDCFTLAIHARAAIAKATA